MPLPPPNPATPPLMTARDIVSDAMFEIGVLAAGVQAQPQDIAQNLRILNRMFDSWAAREIAAFNVDFKVFTLPINKQPITIGPQANGGPQDADWQHDIRPIRIESASLILVPGQPSTEIPIRIRDDDWWANNAIKNLSSTLPTDLYYSPNWPNGSCYFWPIPNTAYQVRLELWGLLGNFPQTGDPFYLPPGYWEAAVLQLALRLAPSYDRTPSPLLVERARDAFRVIAYNNTEAPRIDTVDGGMPSKVAKMGFNWMTRDYDRRNT